MSTITAIHVSNFFTNKAIKENSPLSIMQALKLTYIAQGFHLSLTENSFFNDKIEAWKYGPVITNLYYHLKRIMDEKVYLIKEEQDVKVDFNDKQNDILKVVFGKYAKLGAWELSELTHKTGTPWEETYKDNPNSEIDIDLIKKHFKGVINNDSFVILLSFVKYG